MSARFEVRLACELQSATTTALEGAAPAGPGWERQVAFKLDRQEAALQSLQRLDPHFDPQPWCATARAIGEAAWGRARDILEDWRAADGTTMPEDAASLVPIRRYRGPINLRPHLRRLRAEEREAALAMLEQHSAFMGLPADVALYWADGRRTLAQILDLVELETGVRDPLGLASYFKLVARLGLVELR
jgi:hypothetical protein